jgi:hypothetical protein
MGHKSTHVTEAVYRHVIVPAIRSGASVTGCLLALAAVLAVPSVTAAS